MKKAGIIIAILILSACAKIPVASVTLGQAIAKEGNRMHQRNVVLVNNMFKEKREKIDLFIRDEFTPEYVANFIREVPDDTDFRQELPDMLSSIIPQINDTRDSMQSTLEEQRIKVITKLDEDFAVFEEAVHALNDLLTSATRVDEERKAIYDKINQLSENKIDFNKLESSLDEFISKGGKVGEKISDLNEKIDSIISH